MIPIRDDNPTQSFPLITVSLIIINFIVYAYEVSLGRELADFFARYGVTPYYLLHSGDDLPSPVAAPGLTLLTSLFIHGGFLHVGGNMLYLWIFGNNIEDIMGKPRFIAFYFLAGLAATFLQVAVSPHSKIPTVGASGAIAGVLGAYLLRFPRARVLTLVPFGFFMQMMYIPAAMVLGFWFILQIINGAVSVAVKAQGGVAWFAHVGGFLTGLALVNLLALRRARARQRRRLS